MLRKTLLNSLSIKMQQHLCFNCLVVHTILSKTFIHQSLSYVLGNQNTDKHKPFTIPIFIRRTSPSLQVAKNSRSSPHAVNKR